MANQEQSLFLVVFKPSLTPETKRSILKGCNLIPQNGVDGETVVVEVSDGRQTHWAEQLSLHNSVVETECRLHKIEKFLKELKVSGRNKPAKIPKNPRGSRK